MQASRARSRREVDRQLKPTCRAPKSQAASWRDYGAIILVPSRRGRSSAHRAACAGASRDHGARRRGARRENHATPARSSLGHETPEAIGDYVGGSNHVLPTARSARFSSGLGVLDFMKRTSLLKCDAAVAPSARPRGGRARQGRGARSARPLGRDCGSRRSAFRELAREPETDREPQSSRRGDPRRSEHSASARPISIMSEQWRFST